jgi:hypothetical protein
MIRDLGGSSGARGMQAWLEPLFGALLLAALAAQLAHGIGSDGLTNDELLYIAAGRRHLMGDFRPNPTHPPLAKQLAALGLSGLRLNDLEPEGAGQEDDGELRWAYEFVMRRNDPERVIPRARAPVALLMLLTAAIVWCWARAAGGAAAGLLALALFAFHPSLLAHGHLATTDLPAAFGASLALWAYWRWRHEPSGCRALLVALAVGVAVATRLTGWLLLPAFGLAALTRSGRPARASAFLQLCAALAVVVPLVIWSSYGFRYAPWPGASVYGGGEARLGAAGRAVAVSRAARLLPEAYLEGARYQLAHNRDGHPGFLLGQRARTGFPHYFAVALLLKNTPAFLLALLLAALAALRGRSAFGLAGVLLVPAALVFAVASAGRIQIGERYLLPAYPLLIVFAAVALARSARTRAARVAVALLPIAQAGSALAAAPHGYLAYFNALAGGTQGGHRALLDSNLDWGQDLPRLAAWMRRNGVSSVQLGYHGADDPGRYGIAHEDLPGLTLHPRRPASVPFHGVVAVSPNLLFGVFPRLGDPYAALREREPFARAGVFFVFREGTPADAAER